MGRVSLGLISHGAGENQWVISFLDNEAVIYYDDRLMQSILRLCTKMDSLLSNVLRGGIKIANESYKVYGDLDKIVAIHKRWEEEMRGKYDR